MTNTPVIHGAHRSGRKAERWVSRGFVAPAILGLLVFGVFPFVVTIVFAVSDSTLAKPFGGLAGVVNFDSVFGNSDSVGVLLRSILYAPTVAAASVLLGLVCALVLQTSLWTGSFSRALLILPMLAPPVVVGRIWKLIFAPDTGLLDTSLTTIGLPPVALLSGDWATSGVAIADVWEWTPFCTLLILAALLTQDRQTVEAARLDGAHGFSLFRYITLPTILPALLAVFFVRTIMAFKVFDLVSTLTSGGPGLDTASPSFLIWRTITVKFNVGEAAALSILFALIVAVVLIPIALLIRSATKKLT